MKYFKLFFALCIIFYLTTVQTTLAQRKNAGADGKINLKGVLSVDNENEDSESDPVYTSVNLKNVFNKLRLSGNTMPAEEHPNGLELVSETVSEMIKKDFSFSLVPQHKYMVNNCLGLKVSVGEFRMKLANPYVAIENNGFVIRFTIDKIKLDALTVRMRPCYRDAQCHFSPRFTIGGTASDVTLEIRCNAKIDMDLCKISISGLPTYKWKIGGLNLKPLQNDLDKVAKEMLEDAMNYSSMQLIPIAFYESSEIAMYSSSICQVSELSKNEKSGGQNLYSISGSASSENKNLKKFELIPNSKLKSNTGRIIINPPGDAIYEVTVFNPGTDEVSFRGYLTKEIKLAPGIYDVRIASNNSDYRIRDIVVEKGKDTKIHTGTLDIKLPNTGWRILDEKKEVWVEQGYSNRQVGLPEGKYFVEVGNDFIEIEIKDGEVTEF